MVRQVNAHTNISLKTNGLAQGLPDYNPFLTDCLFALLTIAFQYNILLLTCIIFIYQI